MADDELDQIRKLVRDSQEKKKRDEAGSTFGRVSKEVTIFQKFARQVAAVAIWLWWNFGNPFINRFTVPVIMWVYRRYLWVWNRYALVADEYGNRRLSYSRGGIVLVATLAVVLFAWPTFTLVTDTVMFTLPWTSEHQEEVYLFGSTDNSFADDNWSVTGCLIQPGVQKFECDGEDTLYYRIESSWFSNIYTLLVHHNIFLPEVVGAPVAPGWNRCRVNAVGFRLKFLVRNLQWYINLLDTSCQPIVINNLQAGGG